LTRRAIRTPAPSAAAHQHASASAKATSRCSHRALAGVGVGTRSLPPWITSPATTGRTIISRLAVTHRRSGITWGGWAVRSRRAPAPGQTVPSLPARHPCWAGISPSLFSYPGREPACRNHSRISFSDAESGSSAGAVSGLFANGGFPAGVISDSRPVRGGPASVRRGSGRPPSGSRARPACRRPRREPFAVHAPPSRAGKLVGRASVPARQAACGCAACPAGAHRFAPCTWATRALPHYGCGCGMIDGWPSRWRPSSCTLTSRSSAPDASTFSGSPEQRSSRRPQSSARAAGAASG